MSPPEGEHQSRRVGGNHPEARTRGLEPVGEALAAPDGSRGHCLLLPDGTHLSPRTDGGQTCARASATGLLCLTRRLRPKGFLPTLECSPVTLFGTSGRLKPLSTALSLHGFIPG